MGRKNRPMTRRRPGLVPKRWLNCPPKSLRFIAGKFLAFKTPLSGRFGDQLPFNCMFSPKMVFDFMNSEKAKLGLWFDLTNTDRFYHPGVIHSRGCRYVKLRCVGHGETPSKKQVTTFIEIVQKFFNERPFDIVGVHCTHGFNRTGFLIVSFMVEKLDCSVEAALTAFARARPPGIYKEDYIRELFRRYDDEDDAPPAPPQPEWCFENEVKKAKKTSYEDDTEAFSQNLHEADTVFGNPEDGQKSSEFLRPKKKRRRTKRNERLNATRV